MKKIKSFMEKLKKNSLAIIVVWLAIVILLVAPVTHSVTDANIEGITPFEGIISNLVDNIFKFPIREAFTEKYTYDFIEGIKYFSVFYVIIVVIAIYKNLPKGDFHNIEHGSSDWCINGEQYKILNKKEGIILAKEHYLPLNKPGNTNVLIVGRFWLW